MTDFAGKRNITLAENAGGKGSIRLWRVMAVSGTKYAWAGMAPSWVDVVFDDPDAPLMLLHFSHLP